MDSSPPELLAHPWAHSRWGIHQRSYTPLASKQLQTRNGMIGTVQTQERGGAGGAQPPLNCLTHLGAALHCKDQAAQVEQEQRECSCPWIALTTLGTTSMQVAAQAPPHFLWSAGSHPICFDRLLSIQLFILDASLLSLQAPKLWKQPTRMGGTMLL